MATIVGLKEGNKQDEGSSNAKKRRGCAKIYPVEKCRMITRKRVKNTEIATRTISKLLEFQVLQIIPNRPARFLGTPFSNYQTPITRPMIPKDWMDWIGDEPESFTDILRAEYLPYKHRIETGVEECSRSEFKSPGLSMPQFTDYLELTGFCPDEDGLWLVKDNVVVTMPDTYHAFGNTRKPGCSNRYNFTERHWGKLYDIWNKDLGKKKRNTIFFTVFCNNVKPRYQTAVARHPDKGIPSAYEIEKHRQKFWDVDDKGEPKQFNVPLHTVMLSVRGSDWRLLNINNRDGNEKDKTVSEKSLLKKIRRSVFRCIRDNLFGKRGKVRCTYAENKSLYCEYIEHSCMMFLLFHIEQTTREEYHVDNCWYNRDLSHSAALAGLFYLKLRLYVGADELDYEKFKEEKGPQIFRLEPLLEFCKGKNTMTAAQDLLLRHILMSKLNANPEYIIRKTEIVATLHAIEEFLKTQYGENERVAGKETYFEKNLLEGTISWTPEDTSAVEEFIAFEEITAQRLE